MLLEATTKDREGRLVGSLSCDLSTAMDRCSSSADRVCESLAPGAVCASKSAYLGALSRAAVPVGAPQSPTVAAFHSASTARVEVSGRSLGSPNTSFQGTAGLLRSPAAPELQFR